MKQLVHFNVNILTYVHLQGRSQIEREEGKNMITSLAVGHVIKEDIHHRSCICKPNYLSLYSESHPGIVPAF